MACAGGYWLQMLVVLKTRAERGWCAAWAADATERWLQNLPALLLVLRRQSEQLWASVATGLGGNRPWVLPRRRCCTTPGCSFLQDICPGQGQLELGASPVRCSSAGDQSTGCMDCLDASAYCRHYGTNCCNAACPCSVQISLQQQMASTAKRNVQLKPHAEHQLAVCHRLAGAMPASLQQVATAAKLALQLKPWVHCHSACMYTVMQILPS